MEVWSFGDGHDLENSLWFEGDSDRCESRKIIEENNYNNNRE